MISFLNSLLSKINTCIVAVCCPLFLLSTSYGQSPNPIHPEPPQTVASANPLSHDPLIINYPKALALGLTEGLTEYLPISSLGHLILLNELLDLNHSTPAISLKTHKPLPISKKAVANTYVIGLQIGAILAVGCLYFTTFLQILIGFIGKNPTYKRLGLRLIIAFLPAAILGLLLNQWIETYLFNPTVIACSLFLGGIVILILENYYPQKPHATKALNALTPSEALWIGVCQCFALCPGTSRSLATIIGGITTGLSKADAAEFSFLLGFITLSAASLYKCFSMPVSFFEVFAIGPFLTGFIISFIAAILSIRFFISFIGKKGLKFFGYYRIILAGIIMIFLS